MDGTSTVPPSWALTMGLRLSPVSQFSIARSVQIVKNSEVTSSAYSQGVVYVL